MPFDDQEYTAPSYMIAADTHNIANNQDSWGDVVLKGAPAVVGSAIAQTVNILPTIGNWLGGDFEQIKTKELLQSFDDDIGQYYSRHQEGVDALGFAISSIVPGTFGTKILRGGQTMLRAAAESGTLGSNLTAATGILAPSQPKLLSAAIELALKPNAGFPVWNSATVKALAAGVGQSVLEGAAWETAVAATMYNSPVLEKQDLGDIASNIMWGAASFGVLGGVLNGASVYHKIKGAGVAIDREAVGWTMIREMPNQTKANQVLGYFEEFHTTPQVPKDVWVGEQAWKVGKYESLREAKLRDLDTKIRTSLGELSGGDETLAEHMYHNFKQMSLEGVENKLWQSTEFSRVGVATQAESKLSGILSRFKKTLGFAEGEEEALKNTAFTYVKLTGEDAGKVVGEAPSLLRLADTTADVIKVTPKGVFVGDKNFAFSTAQSFDVVNAASHYEVEARQIWAAKLHSDTLAGIEKVSYGDLPVLDEMYKRGLLPKIELPAKGGIWSPVNKEEFLSFLKEQKEATLRSKIWLQGAQAEEAAKIANVSEGYTTGKIAGDAEDYLFAAQKAAKDYENSFTGAGRMVPGDYFSQPTWAKVAKDITPVKDLDGNVVSGLIAIKQQQKLYEQAADRAIAGILGEDADKFYRLSDTQLNKANRSGMGGGMLSSMNENYGTLAMDAQNLGAQTLKKIQKTHNETRDLFSSSLYKLANKPEASIEFSVLNAKLRQFGETYRYDAATRSMRPAALMKYEEALKAGQNVQPPILPDDLPLQIAIKHPEVAELVQAHIAKNGTRLEGLGSIRANQGLKWNRDAQGFYPIPPNTKDYPHFAFVIDDSIGGAGHSKMLYAATAEDLEKQLTAVKQADPTLKLYTKHEAEKYYQSVGKYEYDRTLTDSTFDAALKRKGVSSPYLVATDPEKIAADFLNWHLDRDSNLIREAVLHQNESQVATLRSMGESYANLTGSHFSNLDPLSYLEMQGKNPYADYVRGMLGLSTKKDFPFWTPLNDMLDRKVSSMFNTVYEMFHNAKSPAELDAINAYLKDAGYQGAAYDSMTHAFANHTAPKGALSSFIQKANAILSSTMLGLDPINSINNLIGSNVLRFTELRSLTKAIESGNTEVAGQLAGLSRIKVPGTPTSMFSPTKMVGNALGDFHSPEGKLLREEFRARGIISSRVEQANWVLENLALTGKETVKDLDSKIVKVFDGIRSAAATGEKLTGNTLAEELNRFVSGHVAKQITDKAVAAGLIGEKEAWAYVNTFVNRVEGNYIAAQRPGVFQGPVGQAMGLFQTYQFNLMQQLLRHVGEGSAKDVALMMGLQSTIYGMKGLPAFDAINTHLIGNASGNTEHRDLYDTVFGAAGKEAGEWLMYGVGSNALGLISPELKANLYSRGDINPRNVTLLPVNPANIPFVQASGKFLGSVGETIGKINAGGDVLGSILQGLEHAGVNRPLAGLAQTLEAANNPMGQSFSTSNKGNVIAANDFLSFTNLIRVAGAKPLDEAIGIDRAFQLDAYAAKDMKARNALGEAVKTSLIAGNQPSADQVEQFSYAYAKAGGKQDKFAQWMVQQYKHANTSQVNELTKNLNSPFSQSMQTIMGGYNMRDFVNQ